MRSIERSEYHGCSCKREAGITLLFRVDFVIDRGIVSSEIPVIRVPPLFHANHFDLAVRYFDTCKELVINSPRQHVNANALAVGHRFSTRNMRWLAHTQLVM